MATARGMASPLADAARAAKTALEAQRTEKLSSFDEIAALAQKTAVAQGVNVNTKYQAHLDNDALNLRVGGLALHDGDMPLRQLGLGSKRMLTTGLQKEALKSPHITLFDEVEIGLEPHRIARLLQHLKDDKTGQYLLTTHSPVVLRELTVADLHIVHKKGGKTTVVAANIPAMAGAIQGKIRSHAEAFLAPKIGVCEGATEAGLLRGLDTYWIGKDKMSFAYQGVAMFDAGGASKIRGVAEALKQLAYDVAVIADSDAPDHFSDADASALQNLGIDVTVWPGGMSVEKRLMADLPWAGVLASIDAALEILDDEQKLLNQIDAKYGAGFNRNRSEWADDAPLRAAIGKAAHGGAWFKSVTKGQQWADAIAPHLDDTAFQTTPTGLKLRTLRTWIDRD
jgi:putative ATP-dependent endonuclease of the OLD family